MEKQVKDSNHFGDTERWTLPSMKIVHYLSAQMFRSGQMKRVYVCSL